MVFYFCVLKEKGWFDFCCFFIYVWFLLRFESFKKEYEVSDIEEVWFDLCNIVMFNNV